MAALIEGKKAPDFELPTVDEKRFSLSESLRKGPVVLAFFKISCPVCQYSFPFVERLFQKLRGRNVSVVGVSQDSVKDTRSFLKEFGITFPIAIDDEKNGYKVSSAYGLTNVPTIFEIGSDGKIAVSCVGWSRADIETIYKDLADCADVAPAGISPLFAKGEQVSDFKAG